MTLYIGPAGWSYTDWAGKVYPDRRPRDFDELRYLTRYFNCIEINTTFYRPADPQMARVWSGKVSRARDFLFTLKLWQKFTHEPGDIVRSDVDVFLRGIDPLLETGLVGAVLVQFPWSFRDTPENRVRLEQIAGAFGSLPLVLEVRHASWNTPEALDLVRSLRMGFCNIDQPASGNSITNTTHVTSSVAYVRLHGRNRQAWFDRNAGRDERYNYLYNDRELEFWVTAIRKMCDSASKVFVITNNHFAGKAVVNALQLRAKLSAAKVDAPAPLVRAYPELAAYVRSEAQQPDLF